MTEATGNWPGSAADPPIESRATYDPPPPRGKGRAFTLALLAHLLLVLALAWGLRWKKDAQIEAVEAELWSATAQIAAPKAAPVQPPPPPPVVAPPNPVPEPRPAPPVVDDSARQAELALEQQKKQEEARREQARLLAQQRQDEERQRREQAQAKAAQQAAAEAKAAKKKAAAEKAAQLKAQADQAKADAARQQDNIRRMTALASSDQSGMTNTRVNGPGATPGGTAKRNAGPSADYFARIRARIKPNITYPDLSTLRGNPQAEVDVLVAPDGTITGKRLRKSSGVPSWDNAVLRAIDKTQILPRDVDGRVFNPMTLVFRPQD